MRNFKFISFLFLALSIGCVSNSLGQKKAVFGKQPKAASKGGMLPTYKDPKIKESPTDWTALRLEYLLGLGGSAFLGDLGGQDGPGQPFVFDFEPTQSRYSATVGLRYFVREYHALKGMLSYARLRGSDATTNYPNRKYRNLNFKSPVIELTANYELHLLKPQTIHLAGARTSRVFDGNRFGAYLSAGAGLFYFNPKAQFNNEWYALKPLNTEGQGLPGGPEPYRRTSFVFPLGGGVTYLLNWNYTIGLDFGYRWTTTDYIDDASGYYYDNDAIVSAYGKLAGTMANPSVLLDDVPEPDWYTKDQPRGGSESNDTYLFLQVTLSHALGPAITNKPIKNKKRKPTKLYRDKKKKKLNRKGGNARMYNNKKIKNKKRRFKNPKLDFKKRRARNKIKTF
ncbi:MAG: hypothetical protein Salg2KO_10590 [Salibacteraceae bacterium]